MTVFSVFFWKNDLKWKCFKGCKGISKYVCNLYDVSAFKKWLEKVTDKTGSKLIFAILNRKLASLDLILKSSYNFFNQMHYNKMLILN
jgi:hypothetical protein